MPQSKIRSLQLNSSDFKTIVESALGAPLNITTPLSAGTALTLSGSPVQWTPVSGGGSSVLGGDGITVTGGSPIGSAQTVAVDSTVARTDITTETFSFAGDVSLNLNDTSQAADEDIWRVGATGSNFIIATRTDADAAGISAISITRTGTTVDDITMPSPLLLTSSGTASTSTALQLNSTNPAFVVNKTNATANQGVWDVTGETDGQLIWRTRTDAFGTGATWLTVNRSGTTVGDVAFTGTRLTFNGVPVKLGSPDTGGGGTVTSVDITAGTLIDKTGGPITTSGSITVDVDLSEATEAVYAPATDYLLFLDGGVTGTAAKESGADFASALAGTGLTATSGVLSVTGGSVTATTGSDNRIAVFTSGTNIEGDASFQWDASAATMSIYDTGDTDSVEFRNTTNNFFIKPTRTAPLWVTRSYGSPIFTDFNTSTTNPTMIIGHGSPTTTQAEATLAILDNYGPGLVLRDTFNNREASIRTTGMHFRYNGFWTLILDDNAGNSNTVMSVLTNDVDAISDGPVIQWQQSLHGDMRLNPRTSNESGSDTGWTYSTTDMVTFVSPNTSNINFGGGPGGSNGLWLTVVNAAAGPGSPNITDTITFEHEEATAAAARRFLLPGGGDVVLRPHDSIQLIYDGNVSRWRCMATTGVQQSGSPIA